MEIEKQRGIRWLHREEDGVSPDLRHNASDSRAIGLLRNTYRVTDRGQAALMVIDRGHMASSRSRDGCAGLRAAQ